MALTQVNIRIDASLHERAKAAGLNVSAAARVGIEAALREIETANVDRLLEIGYDSLAADPDPDQADIDSYKPDFAILGTMLADEEDYDSW